MLIRFKRNTAYKGENYGPDYPEEVAEVEKRWAVTFLAQGRAVPADVKPKRVSGSSEPPKKEAGGEGDEGGSEDDQEPEYPGKKGDVQHGDPATRHQDPLPPLQDREIPDDFPGADELAGAGVETLGDLLAFLEAGGDLEGINGIGDVTAEKISKALHEAVLESAVS